MKVTTRKKTVCKICYDEERIKNNNNTLIKTQQPKISNVNTNNNNRTLIIGFYNCGKTYLMNYILLQKQETIYIISKSLNQYPHIKAQTSDGIQPLEIYENSTVGFDMLLSKQACNIDVFFRKGRH